MVKSHVEELLHVYRCLFMDIGNTYPEMRVLLEKDLDTLITLSTERGLNLFCVDLPNVGKHLDRCVSEGRFMVCGMPLTKRCPRRIMYPEFLKGLWGLVFLECGVLKEDCDVEALLLLRQVYLLAKKLKHDCPNEAVLEEVQEFIDTDSLLPEPEEVWETTASMQETYQGFARSPFFSKERLEGHGYTDQGGDDPSSVAARELGSFSRKLDLITNLVTTSLGPYRPEDWRFRHGPGVVAERVGEINKYQFVNWSENLESVFAYADCCFYNHESWARQVLSTSVTGEIPSSRLIAVPKTITKPRLIAAEPSEHMWCQQNIWDYMRRRVDATWIADFVRFNDQSLNQELCLKGSRDGSLATLDLSSASDRVTCHFVGQMFRSNPPLLHALRASRTQSLTQSLAKDLPMKVTLKKFSTMGSACTFPVETLGFLSVALAAVATKRRLRVTVETLRSLRGEVSVFGDDIIIPEDSRELAVRALEVLCFKVNTSKCFWNGKFRESCGVDAYRGVDITPVYWRGPCNEASEPEEIASAVEVRNSFHKRGFWAVAEHLASTIPVGMIPRVRIDSGVFGFSTFCEPRLDGHFRRWNWLLQRDEVLVARLTSRARIREPNDDSALLQYFTERPEPHDGHRCGVRLRPDVRIRRVWDCSASVTS